LEKNARKSMWFGLKEKMPSSSQFGVAQSPKEMPARHFQLNHSTHLLARRFYRIPNAWENRGMGRGNANENFEGKSETDRGRLGFMDGGTCIARAE
jgi:hypothetical protein